MLRRLFTLLLTLIPVLLFSQDSLKNQESRLVKLIDAKSAEMKQIDGREYRKVTGPAQFLHNNALIICDTAVWDVLSNTIDAIGNVKIIQNQTTLLSDRIKYVADRSVAEVRGKLVELVDKENNKLRTHYLDYFTKDSTAVFYNGGSMVNKDGNTIESLNGYYYGKQEKFLFQMNVQMEADSVLLSADSLAYMANQERVIFLSKTYAWQNDGFLYAKGGWYDRKNELFHFTKEAYIKTKENEIWADTINYNKNAAEAELFNNIQILDTAQSAILFADYATFKQKPFKAVLTNRPSVASYTVENGVADTLFFAADTIKYYTLLKSEVDSSIIAQSEDRFIQSKKDPIGEILKKQPLPKKLTKIPTKKPLAVTPQKKDTLFVKNTPVAVKDTLMTRLTDTLNLNDTLKQTVDTTTVKFLYANKSVKFYRSNLQGICDSLLFNSIDSLIRMFKDPVIWTENNQFTSDSVQVVISDRKLKKAELISSAFVVMQEDSTHFNQIKSADIVAFFNSDELSRFDAYGGVSILFFFSEDSVLTTMNEKECKAMSAILLDKKIERIRYFEGIQSNAYPLYKLEQAKQKLKGFRWLEGKRPKSRLEVSDRSIKASQTSFADSVEKPTFVQTSIYFGRQPNGLPVTASKPVVLK